MDDKPNNLTTQSDGRGLALFAMVMPPAIMMRPNLSTEAKLTAGLLWAAVDHMPGTAIETTCAQIGAAVGRSDRRARSYVSELRDVGFLDVDERRSGRTGGIRLVIHGPKPGDFGADNDAITDANGGNGVSSAGLIVRNGVNYAGFGPPAHARAIELNTKYKYSGSGSGSGPEPQTGTDAGNWKSGKADGEPSLAELARTYPILGDAITRRIKPREAKDLYNGVFRAVEEKHFAEPVTMVVWFQGQLSAARPATGDTEAELLLVLAAAAKATRMKREAIKTSRVAFWVNVVSKGKWMQVVPYLADAKKSCEEARQTFTDQGEPFYAEDHQS